MQSDGSSKFAGSRLTCALAVSIFAAAAPLHAQTPPPFPPAALFPGGYPPPLLLPPGVYAATPSGYTLVPGAYGVIPEGYPGRYVAAPVPRGVTVSVQQTFEESLAESRPPPRETTPLAAAAEGEGAGAWEGLYFSLDFFGTHSIIRDHELTPVGGQTTLEIRHEDDQVAGNSLALGYALDGLPLRVEVEAGVRYRFDLDYRAISPANANLVTGYGTNLATLFAMLDGYYDFDLGSDWTPYLGAGVGWARHWAETTRFNHFTGAEVKEDFYNDNLAWSLMGGVHYDWSPNWRIGVEARYADLGDVEIGPFAGGDKIASEYTSFDFVLGFTYLPWAGDSAGNPGRAVAGGSPGSAVDAEAGVSGTGKEAGRTADAAGNGDGSAPLWGAISELRLGVLDHSVDVISSERESGTQINMEMLFVSPDVLGIILGPRPHLGLSANSNLRFTSFLYSGLTWTWNIYRGLFLDLALGLSVHDGWLRTHEPEPGRSLHGSRVLFREALELGYRIGRHSLSVMVDHYSNAGLFANRNQGNDDCGLRYGYAF